MPRPRIHAFWIDRIRVLVANEPALSGAQVRRRLLDGSFKDAPTPVPSDRAIRRIVTEFPPEERKPYKYFSWPASMKSGALPWEASRACLDLLVFFAGTRRRPLNALAENFWRVTQAIPDAPIGWRVTVAFYLTKVSMSDKPHTDLTSVEWSLAYQTWRSEKDVDAYENAIKIGLIPKPPTPVDLSLSTEDEGALYGLDPKVMEALRKPPAPLSEEELQRIQTQSETKHEREISPRKGAKKRGSVSSRKK